jgi:ribosomal protein S21
MPIVVSRKEKETNHQVIRRFNRGTQQNKALKEVRDRQHFEKAMTRNARRRVAARRAALRATIKHY